MRDMPFHWLRVHWGLEPARCAWRRGLLFASVFAVLLKMMMMMIGYTVYQPTTAVSGREHV